MNVQSLIRSQMPRLIKIRRHLHQNPEHCLKEFRTAEFIEQQLKDLGLEPKRLCGTGVVAVIRGRGKGKTVALRADIDALQIEELTRLPYASKNGFMHACGHDGHTTMLLGVAGVLTAMRDSFSGNVKLIFQPAEETVGGADRLCKAGALDNPRVDAVFGLHGWPEDALGTITASPGVTMAAVDSLRMTVSGRGGHGAKPQHTIDPVLIAARVIEGLQSIVSRNISPVDCGVVTVASIHGGTGSNIIPDRVEMTGTLRSISETTRKMIFDNVKRVATNTARANGGRCHVGFGYGYPAVVNEPEMTALVQKVGRRLLGEGNVLPQELTMGAEDFAYYLQRVKGCYFRIGLAQKGQPIVALHNARFDFNDKAMPVGIGMMVGVATEFLHGKNGGR